MYRFLTLFVLLAVSVPIGMSIAGCANNDAAYCTNSGFGKRVSDVDSIDLEPKLTGISLAYGQTSQIPLPSAFNCNHVQISGTVVFTYGSTNKQLVDLSPAGAICAGTWNRTSSGGIPDFTICSPPAGSGTSQLTAQGGGATSNPITVYVHPPVVGASLVAPPGCVSQNNISQLDVTASVNGPGATPVLFCAPYGNSGNNFNSCSVNPANGVPDCTCNLGHIPYTAQTPSLVRLDPNGVATALLPGTSLIAATVSGASLNAGYFTTCPPASIVLSVPPTDIGSTGIVTVTGTAAVPVTATVTDTTGKTITGVPLTFTSTNPSAIFVGGSSGSVTTSFPGVSQISAVCEPPQCNPAPIDKIGQFSGTGLPVTSSNTLTFQSPGNSNTLLWVGSSASPYFTHFDLSVGTQSSPVKMPYTPNSMVLDPSGSTLYFGSYRELMVYSASASSLTKEDISVPGVVLGVSPAGDVVVICDQIRKLIYLYSPSSGITATIGGVGTRATFSRDETSIYIVGPTALYVHNLSTGWSTYSIPTAVTTPDACPLDNTGSNPFCSPDVSVTKPSVGAFLSGTSTTARSYCFDPSVEPPYFPATADLEPATDKLSATANGKHVIGATATPATLTDIVTNLPVGPCPDNNTPINFASGFSHVPLPVTPTDIDQVVTSTDSSLAFVTYTGGTAAAGTAAILPVYQVPATGANAGTITPVALSGTATAPVAGVFSPNSAQFFVGTSGDDLVHIIDVKTLTDTTTLNPGLPDASGKPVTPEFLAVRPRPIA